MAEEANDYRNRAEEADKKADEAKTPELLQVWREVARHWRDLTMAVMGIGSIEPSDILAVSGNAFATSDRERLIADGAVGDICHRIFRADGSAITGAVDDRIIAIPVEDLRRIPRRIGIAGGKRKREAIRGALSGGWVNALVTDLQTAEELAGPAETN